MQHASEEIRVMLTLWFKLSQMHSVAGSSWEGNNMKDNFPLLGQHQQNHISEIIKAQASSPHTYPVQTPGNTDLH